MRGGPGVDVMQQPLQKADLVLPVHRKTPVCCRFEHGSSIDVDTVPYHATGPLSIRRRITIETSAWRPQGAACTAGHGPVAVRPASARRAQAHVIFAQFPSEPWRRRRPGWLACAGSRRETAGSGRTGTYRKARRGRLRPAPKARVSDRASSPFSGAPRPPFAAAAAAAGSVRAHCRIASSIAMPCVLARSEYSLNIDLKSLGREIRRLLRPAARSR